MKKKILISTGGSGGHVIPATIFYEQLKNEFDVFLSTDKRGTKFLNLQEYAIKIIDIPKLTKNLFKVLDIQSRSAKGIKYWSKIIIIIFCLFA